MLSARSPRATPGVNGGKGTGGGAGRVHWSGAETLAPEGVKPPEDASRSDTILDAHVSVSERGNEEAIRTARQQPCGSPRGAATDDGDALPF